MTAALLLPLSACGGGGDTTVSGYVQVFGVPDTGSGAACDTSQAEPDYADVEEGAQVVVKNSDGKQVGVGDLSAGKTNGTLGCRFDFKITGVDSDDSYTVTVADQSPKAFNADDAGDVKVVLGY